MVSNLTTCYRPIGTAHTGKLKKASSEGQSSELTRSALLVPVLKGVCIYSGLLWAYIVFTVIVRPEWQYFDLSVYIPIHENILAVASFAVSFLCYVSYQYLEKAPG